ncbi:hypothetical protein PPL_05817 [Heterostelium album PN500]|uniref:PRELI/MSF1 domain-containing protein n=1 Tax=Heterostelium pallidum (strain ATCC 26659 / Pp 5 / PN500) TaxID=670386 RepID=D3BBF1_HETP5|nr:hypothetical protein PPL_05817 [Heterostelium album PN500]EFA80984.1 hypothetical protein PPL_05817 [Heterostelium album PN500]|eukprot:XP_020433102.1 hypothetical protein PPL_05817 [Heterostelium album PN500]
MPATHSFPPYTYEISVEEYIEVYYRRFPQHKLFPYILDSEVIEHRHNEDGTETIIRKTKLDIDAPGWFKTLFGIHHSIFIEEATIDKVNRTVTIKTINETLSSKANLLDTTIYSVHPENPNWCTFTQTGSVTLLVSVLGFQKKIEKYCLNLYTSRYNESRELDKKMIEEYRQEKLNNQNPEVVVDSNATQTATTANSSSGEQLMMAQ